MPITPLLLLLLSIAFQIHYLLIILSFTTTEFGLLTASLYNHKYNLQRENTNTSIRIYMGSGHQDKHCVHQSENIEFNFLLNHVTA
jgi:hypothetical protein